MMLYEIDNSLLPREPTFEDDADDQRTQVATGGAGSGDLGTLPPWFVYTERIVAALRAYLDERGLGHYAIYNTPDPGLYDLDEHLPALGEPGATWETLPAWTPGGEPMSSITFDEHANGDAAAETIRAKAWSSGCLRLASLEVVIARWYWLDPLGYSRTAWFFAAPTPAHVARLRQQIRASRRGRATSVWQVVRGGDGSCDHPQRVPREPVTADDLILPEGLRRRIDAEVIRFFSPEVAALYRALKVPHRRGVLLHGPPGNGKTSLIRLIGAALPEVPVILLRPGAQFDTDDLEEVLHCWATQAPAILVIEDLNWLLDAVKVSTFLNLIDGVETHATRAEEGGGAASGGGLLLIGTTNHPDRLDPAVNNRPGRFDVVIEIASPDRALRLDFLRRKLPEIAAAPLERVASVTEGLSFAHLQELLRLSGLLAIHAGRSGRADEDVIGAADIIRRNHDDATRGFPVKPERPFGLAPR